MIVVVAVVVFVSLFANNKFTNDFTWVAAKSVFYLQFVYHIFLSEFDICKEFLFTAPVPTVWSAFINWFAAGIAD